MDVQRWQRRLEELAARYKVPGAALGILRMTDGDEVAVAATGLLNTATGVEATPDSLFQIGSMTKSLTATVVLRLVDDGALDLDRPVIEYLPELRLGDAEVTKKVTARHLLNHTSGIDGDVFTDTGWGDDCLEKYVAALDGVGQNHPLGATFSYCNSGYILLGRLIERLTGGVWDQAMRDLLFAPLRLTHTATLPDEALMFRTAVGHQDKDGRAVPVHRWGMPRAGGPAGSNVSCSVEDVLAFARLHLAGGTAADGTRVLSDRGVSRMREHEVTLPDQYTLGDSWGLGLIRYSWSGHRVFGHDGNTIGQSAFLRFLPERRLALTLLTNGGQARDLYQELFGEILAAEAGVTLPAPLEPPKHPVEVDHRPYLGTYERAGVRTEIFERDGRPWLRATLIGTLAELGSEDAAEEQELVPVRDDLFVMRGEGEVSWTPVLFYRLADGSPYVHFGARATPKIS